MRLEEVIKVQMYFLGEYSRGVVRIMKENILWSLEMFKKFCSGMKGAMKFPFPHTKSLHTLKNIS